MTGSTDTAPRRLRPRLIAVLVLTVLVLAALGSLSASALTYGATLRDGHQLLRGTTIASVDVGEVSVAAAREAVREHLEPRLERTITLTHGDLSWSTTPRELGATTDLDEAVAAAAARADDLGFADLVRLRWLGSADGLRIDVTTTIPEEGVAAFVAGIADELERGARDAQVAMVDDELAVTVEGRSSRHVLRDDATAALLEILHGDGGDAQLTVPIESEPPVITTEIAEQVVTDVTTALEVALDRAVAVTLEGRSETVTPRELGATFDLDPLLDAAFTAATGGGDAALEVALHIGDAAIGGVVDAVSAGSVVAARDASLELSNGRFQITPERNGAAVDRGAAIAEVRAALRGAADRVELELRTVRPTVTAASFDEDMLVVDAASTTLTLFRGGEATRSWPVAVGTNNSPTPKGTFVVGAKRFEPVWTNPAKDRWGKDMPDRIGPGPDNPLGARAINWNTTGGRDTLIRFHGTPNEDSIGSAASNGCVRMFNADVIELYELVSPGMTIISR